MSSDSTKLKDFVNVEIIDKADRNIDSEKQRTIGLWFEDVCDALEKGLRRNRDSDMMTLHNLLDDLRRETQESCQKNQM